MRGEQLTILSQKVRARLNQEVTIDESLLRELVSAVADIVIDSDEVTEEYRMLTRDVDAIYSYSDIADSPAFSVGACWGALNMSAAIASKKSEPIRVDALKSIAKKHTALFVALRDNPGITQQELAKKLGKTKSNLAQILARLDKYQLFVANQVGKYKKYYLSTAGQTALAGVEQASLESNRRHKNYQSMPQDMMMQIDGIIVSYGERRGVIDMRGGNYRVPIPMSSGSSTMTDTYTSTALSSSPNRRKHLGSEDQEVIPYGFMKGHSYSDNTKTA